MEIIADIEKLEEEIARAERAEGDAVVRTVKLRRSPLDFIRGVTFKPTEVTGSG